MLRRFAVTFAVVMNLLLVDQAVKAAAVVSLKGQPARVVLDNLFNLAYVENRGCAWGMLQGHVWPLAVFAVLALALLFWKREAVFPAGRLGVVAEMLLYGGIVGNLIDRVVRGHVVDMFDFHWGVHHFPCFNVADAYITVAAAILVLVGFFPRLDGRRAKAQPPAKGGGDGRA